MARMRRLVVPGYPHHVTQRGNRRQRTFFKNDDYAAYIELISQAKVNADVEVWAYCLMPNHVHLVVIPHQADSLADLFQEAHRQYTLRINARHRWTGHLWQDRFRSYVMDEQHLISAVRYIEMNPVKAKLCRLPGDWCWSSARAHLHGTNDSLVRVAPLLQREPDWNSYLHDTDSDRAVEDIHKHSSTGRPLGSNAFLRELEARTGRTLMPQKRGRRPDRK